MLKMLLNKLKESLISVLPVALIVIILFFTPLVQLSITELVVFIISAFLLILGISLFNLGADLAMHPMGEQVGSSLMKTRKLFLILIVCFVMGLLITIAEPDLSVLASQVKEVLNESTLIISIGFGVGLFLILAILKIIFKKNLSLMIMYFYLMIFALVSLVVINGNERFLPLSFDSGGVTTGPITVPFIMALGVGIANSIGGKNANENSFGLVGLCSIGPVIAILILSITIKGNISYSIPTDYYMANNALEIFKHSANSLLSVIKEVALALGLIVIFFFVIQTIYIKLPKKKILQIIIGIIYTFLGLVIFLTAVNVGFMPIGFKLGKELSQNKIVAIIFSFILGCVVVLAEPAIHVLTKQVEEVTNGGVSKKSMLISLSVGVGVSICLSIIRIFFDFSILYYLIPGYCISLGLAFFVPRMYTAIAFDSGGVASGPLTSSFILPFSLGLCSIVQGEGKIMSDAFGIVSMVAMTPLITIQLLGFKAVMTARLKNKIMMKKIISSANDEQIIDFM